MNIPPTSYIILEIGQAGQLTLKNAKKVAQNIKAIIERLSPVTALDVAVSGYDDDPREIWEIPEARRYIIKFANEILKAGVPPGRFLPGVTELVNACIAADQKKPVVVYDEPTVTIQSQLKEFQDSARKNIH